MVINDLLPARDLSSRNVDKPSLNLFIFPVSSTSLALHPQPPAQEAAGRLLCQGGPGFEWPVSVSFVGSLAADGIQRNRAWLPPLNAICSLRSVRHLRRKQRKV